jgi:hypothetical protein
MIERLTLLHERSVSNLKYYAKVVPENENGNLESRKLLLPLITQQQQRTIKGKK